MPARLIQLEAKRLAAPHSLRISKWVAQALLLEDKVFGGSGGRGEGGLGGEGGGSRGGRRQGAPYYLRIRFVGGVEAAPDRLRLSKCPPHSA